MFTGLSSLTKLVITGFKQFTRILSLPATLEFLQLSENGIKVIEPDAFLLLNKLTHLNLDKNCLTAEKAFPALFHLTHLEHLSLRNNLIDSLEGFKVIYMPRLQVLILCSNQVTQLSKQTFATFPGLVNLDLTHNRITDIETGAFDGLVNLRVLRLICDNMKVFYFNVFESAANKLGSPVNLMELSLYAEPLESAQWSPETIHLSDKSMSEEANEREQQDDDASAKQFAKCGFRNKLDILLYNCWYNKKMINKFPYLNKLALRDLVRLRW
jgi:hypothetical protein